MKRAGDPLMPTSADLDALRDVERETGHAFGPRPGETREEQVSLNGRRAAIEAPPGFVRNTRAKVVATFGRNMRRAYDALTNARTQDPAGRYTLTQNAEGWILVEGA